MRLPAERIARSCAFALILAHAGTGCLAHSRAQTAAATPAAGPAADYPVVLGSPYTIGTTRYIPADAMNYDEVGYVAPDSGAGITGASHTLPLPSYVEVTSLETGKTILVRIERRGPMNGDALVALTPAAMAQLGAASGAPVRVRRVNPPEEERAALRAGRPAAARMETPASLVAVLKRKLPVQGSASLQSSPGPSTAARPALPRPVVLDLDPKARIAPAPAASGNAPLALPPLPKSVPHGVAIAPAVVAHRGVTQRAASARQESAVEKGGYGVQAAAMSTFDRAREVAGAIGGSVSKEGRYFRVRTGPFASRREAEASLAKVRAAGYSDARIFTNG